MILAQIMSVVLLADTSIFITAIAPIVTGVVGAIFTYLGLRLNSKAKASDQNIAQQAQEYEGINLGQQFMKDALAEAKTQLSDVRVEMSGLREQIKQLVSHNAELVASNQLLLTHNKAMEEQISRLERSISGLREIDDA